MPGDLNQACFELARTTQWDTRPVDTDEIAALGNRFADVARERIESNLGIDEALLTRAVVYLNEAHAIPPMRDNTIWFAHMLDAVLEVACPNSGLNQGKAFLQDMLHGIGSFLTDD